ncbi:hypothetical protein EN41_25510 [Agrobacterium tumefaciens]|nr:hypothetical protein EN41_25510 [Agrobacterium tumefaciens]
MFDDIVVDVCHVSMPLLRLTVTQRLDLVETCDDRIFGGMFFVTSCRLGIDLPRIAVKKIILTSICTNGMPGWYCQGDILKFSPDL